MVTLTKPNPVPLAKSLSSSKSHTTSAAFAGSHVHHHDVVIPENALEGNYHLVVYCTDAAGNQSLVAREIVLYHDADEHHHHDDDDDED